MISQFQRQNIARQLSDWYQVKHRQVLLAQIQTLFHHWLDGCFGYYAAEISLLDQSKDWFHAKNIPMRFRFGAIRSLVVTDFENLPIDSESLDFIAVCHVLEFIENPHSLLREIDRVLIPEGKLLIISFNPYGWQVVGKLFHRRARAPWCGHFYSAYRIQDWLSVLGFDMEAVHHALVPIGTGAHLFKLSWKFIDYLPLLYSVSALFASKRVSSLKPVGKAWRPTFLKKHVAQPTTLDIPNVRQEAVHLH